MKDKLRILYLPFVISFFALLIGYTFLHWSLSIHFNIIVFSEITTNFAIPSILATLIVIVVIRPKIKILNLDSKKSTSDYRMLYYVVFTLGMAVPTIIAQEYLQTATGKLTTLENISELGSSAKTKYYSVKDFYLDKSAYSLETDFQVGGKHNEKFTMYFYISTPMLSQRTDTVQNICYAWLGTIFSKKISNRLDTKEKEEIYYRFAEDSFNEYVSMNLNEFIYLERVNETEDKKILFDQAIAKNTVCQSVENTVFITKNEAFEARNGNKLKWLFITTCIAFILLLIMILIPKVDKTHLHRIKQKKPDIGAIRDTKEMLSLLIPHKGYFITPILIHLNLIVFIVMVIAGYGFISFNGADLITWGANYGPLTTSGEWWRLLTCTFLHGGIMHLLLNLYGLLIVGIFLEPAIGRIKFAGIYIFSGIIASIASLYWDNTIISIGASGAIFGLYGCFLALLLFKVYSKELNQLFLISTLLYIGINLLMGLGDGIDNAAHIGGLICGFILGIIIYFTFPRIKNETPN